MQIYATLSLNQLFQPPIFTAGGTDWISLKSCSVSATSVILCLPSAAVNFNWLQFVTVSFPSAFSLFFKTSQVILEGSFRHITASSRVKRLFKSSFLTHGLVFSCHFWQNFIVPDTRGGVFESFWRETGFGPAASQAMPLFLRCPPAVRRPLGGAVSVAGHGTITSINAKRLPRG